MKRNIYLILLGGALLVGGAGLTGYGFNEEYSIFRKHLESHHRFLEDAYVELEEANHGVGTDTLSSPDSGAAVRKLLFLTTLTDSTIKQRTLISLVNRQAGPVDSFSVRIGIFEKGQTNVPRDVRCSFRRTSSDPWDSLAVAWARAGQKPGMHGTLQLRIPELRPGESGEVGVAYTLTRPPDPVQGIYVDPRKYPALDSLELHLRVENLPEFTLLPRFDTDTRKFNLFQVAVDYVVTLWPPDSTSQYYTFCLGPYPRPKNPLLLLLSAPATSSSAL